MGECAEKSTGIRLASSATFHYGKLSPRCVMLKKNKIYNQDGRCVIIAWVGGDSRFPAMQAAADVHGNSEIKKTTEITRVPHF